MSSDFQLTDPIGWEWDLQSIYTAYMEYFQSHNVPWYDRSWGHIFATFEEFLSFSWPVIVLTDVYTARPHIVTRTNSIKAFVKMIRTRYGETIPIPEDMIHVTAFEATQRPVRTVNDIHSYRKVHHMLAATALAALKVRVRSGEHTYVKELWDSKDKTFLAIDFEWSERNKHSCLEWGYAVLRAGYLTGLGTWPPTPEKDYRSGHYIIGEYVNKVVNKHQPSFPWQYGYGESQVIPKAKLPQVIQAVISSLASPESESQPNSLVLVAHGISGDLARMDEMKIKIPSNILILDTATYERHIFNAGHRGIMNAPNGTPRQPGSTLSLSNLLYSYGVEVPCIMHNSGNDALMCLVALQKMFEPDRTPVPKPSAKGMASMTPMTPMGSPMPMMNPGFPMMLPMMAALPNTPGSFSIPGTPRSATPGALTPSPSLPAQISHGGQMGWNKVVANGSKNANAIGQTKR